MTGLALLSRLLPFLGSQLPSSDRAAGHWAAVFLLWPGGLDPTDIFLILRDFQMKHKCSCHPKLPGMEHVPGFPQLMNLLRGLLPSITFRSVSSCLFP